ncbi:uncharacterized protein LOC132637746 [Lycium barbarum]|uniref:uncharacterized protein LOC132637746 n=1 Tax=Lycium barbarum TaxID=112863 RepID=UPI00293F6333|nr:uncharacterized protein LOC132637746 [Lycium barbarum]
MSASWLSRLGSIQNFCARTTSLVVEDDLYNVYSTAKTSKELWDALEKKYKTEDACLKKFVVAKFLDYKMMDNKSVGTQVQELQVLIHDLLAEGIIRVNTFIASINYTITYKFNIVGMIINEAFQVVAMIEKLPPSWRDFKKLPETQMQGNDARRSCDSSKIEEDNKAAERKVRSNSTISGANIVETAQPKSSKRKKSSGPANNSKKKKFKGENFKGDWYNCGKTGHKSVDCRAHKNQKKKNQANIIEKNEEEEELCAMFSECSLVGNPTDWWIDSGATRDVCSNKEMFISYAPAGPEETIFMGNSATAKVEGAGNITLKMTLGKTLTLKNVLHVPEIRKNLVSTGLLVKNSFKCVYVSDKVVISKNDMYMGKGYLTEGLLKLNVIAINNNKVEVSSYLLESDSLWHEHFLTFLLENEPQNFKEAITSSEAQYWKEAVNGEIESILNNHTWELVDLPPENKPLGSKWIFKRKMKDDGTIDKYKVRLVVKGFRQ